MPRSRANDKDRVEIPTSVVVMVGCIVALVVGYFSWTPVAPEIATPSDEAAVVIARQAIDAGRWDLALEPLQNATEPDAVLLRAGVLLKLERFEEAVGDFSRLFDDEELGVIALGEAASIRLGQGRLTDALSHFQAAHERSGENPLLPARIALIEAIAGRLWKAIPPLKTLLGQRVIGKQELCFLAKPSAIVPTPVEFRGSQIDDPLIELSRAWTAFLEGRFDDSDRLVRELLESPSAPHGVHDLRLTLQHSRGELNASDFEDIPRDERSGPIYWTLRGRTALEAGDPEGAIRCALEAQHAVPDHRASLELLRAAAAEAGDRSTADAAAARGRDVAVVNQAKDLLTSLDDDGLVLQPVCDALVRLGRLSEAGHWVTTVERACPNAEWTRSAIYQAAEEESTRSFVASLDREQFRLPLGSTSFTSDAPPEVGVASLIRFENDAARAGLDLMPFVRSDVGATGRFMQEFTGSGVCVVDYDRDSLPDLFFPRVQWSLDDLNRGHTEENAIEDALFRNSFGRKYVRETGVGLDRVDFSQGAAAGDVDGDGFPDLYVANVGGNTLYLNNGDGTYSDARLPSSTVWTTSVAIADVDGDGVSDLVDVNYVSGTDVYTKRCEDGESEGPKRACSPLSFLPTSDTFLRGNGNGTFQAEPLVSGDCRGNGLGLLIGRLAAAGGSVRSAPDLYIANDMSPNRLIIRESDGFNDVALLAGAAFNGDGAAEAGMGLAWGDADGDGQGDIFVTNFLNETNTLYGQNDGAFFDRTQDAALLEPSVGLLGFGTEFLDADLDGDHDLIVTNGHIDDFTPYGVPFKMPPSVMENVGGRFRPVSQPGKYLSDTHVGRALATLDWNGDFREDVVITHLEAGPALLTNRSETASIGTSVRLIATRSQRDAVGAMLRVTHTERDQPTVLQVTAGDGYMTCNSKTLTFSGGAADEIVAEITWPSGTSEKVALQAGKTWTVVEGQAPTAIP